jgi:hypothetical protein
MWAPDVVRLEGQEVGDDIEGLGSERRIQRSRVAHVGGDRPHPIG